MALTVHVQIDTGGEQPTCLNIVDVGHDAIAILKYVGFYPDDINLKQAKTTQKLLLGAIKELFIQRENIAKLLADLHKQDSSDFKLSLNRIHRFLTDLFEQTIKHPNAIFRLS